MANGCDPTYYGADGAPITMQQWGRLLLDEEYRRVGDDTLPSGARVSTVWLGLDHNFSGCGPPLVFETIILLEGSWPEADLRRYHDMRRYATREQALAGHAEMVEKWREAGNGAAGTSDEPARG